MHCSVYITLPLLTLLHIGHPDVTPYNQLHDNISQTITYIMACLQELMNAISGQPFLDNLDGIIHVIIRSYIQTNIDGVIQPRIHALEQSNPKCDEPGFIARLRQLKVDIDQRKVLIRHYEQTQNITFTQTIKRLTNIISHIFRQHQPGDDIRVETFQDIIGIHQICTVNFDHINSTVPRILHTNHNASVAGFVTRMAALEQEYRDCIERDRAKAAAATAAATAAAAAAATAAAATAAAAAAEALKEQRQIDFLHHIYSRCIFRWIWIWLNL
jgi:hypothetical protein